MQILKSLDPPQRVDRRLEDVVRIVGAEGLREDVLDARRLEDRPYGAARDNARPGHRWLQEHTARAEVPGDLARDRGLAERNEDQILLRVLDRLADRLRHLVRLAEADADVPAPIADDHQRREREAPSTFHDLRDAIDGHHPIVQLQRAGIDLRFRHSVSP